MNPDAVDTHRQGAARRRVVVIVRALLGNRPRMLLCFVAPTLLAVLLDVVIRARALGSYNTLDRLNYFGSTMASAGFWSGPLWIASYLFSVRGKKRLVARLGLGLFFSLWVLPFSIFCFGGQVVYHRVFHSYMARDTVRLGIALRGTLREWLVAWGGTSALIAMLVPGVFITIGLFFLARKAAPSVARALPIVPVLGFSISSACFWTDFVESRSLQAAPPDTCFIHGVVHALHDGLTGKGWVRRGISLRTPAPLPPLATPTHRPNVMVILTESVRADALCSDPKTGCSAPFLDEVAPDRVGLGRLTTQSPGTFTASMMLWTGLGPNVDFATAHQAPVLWEIAKAIGYRTSYVTSQNLRYDDFGAFTQNAGIDRRISAMELEGTIDAQIGAPDERATQRMLELVAAVPDGTPYFAMLHFSNTHAPYRTDPSLLPFMPESPDPFGDLAAFHNHYLNSVRLQERTLADFLRALRAMPRWDDTVVIFLSDHGEQFREHGGLYHLTSLFEEQVRIPGFVVFGPHALDPQRIHALSTFRERRTYSQDLTATILDLLGVLDARPTLPFAKLTTGRSLLRDAPSLEPIVPLSTASGVWEPNESQYGVMSGDLLLVGAPSSPWRCYNLVLDPGEVFPLGANACGAMADVADRDFAGLGIPRE